MTSVISRLSASYQSRSRGSADGSHSTPLSSSNKGHNSKHENAYYRYINWSRVLFIAVLTITAALLGFASFYVLTQSEERLGREQFDAIAERALDMALDIASRRKKGIIALTSIMEQAFPDASVWPFVEMNGFEVVSNHVIDTAGGENAMGVMPIVRPEQRQDFEQFAVRLFPEATHATRLTGLDATFQRYNETDGEVHWGSPYKLFVPFLYHNRGPLLLLSNYHSIESRGRELDRVMDCAQIRATELQANASRTPRQCSLVTGILDLGQRQPTDPDYVPSSVLYQPIFPANNVSVLTGFITSTIKWHETLFNVFSSEVNGVDCVLQTETQVFTYKVDDGQVTLRGEGDLHNPHFEDYGQSIQLTSLYSATSPNYTLSLYPSQEFLDVYTTDNPVFATIGAVCIVILTAAIFFLYDSFVRKEFNHKAALDQARRRFVRFISHEVRTPLNAVVMGLQLQQDEAARLSSIVEKKEEESGDNNINNKESSVVPTAPSTSTASTAMDKIQKQVTELSNLGSDILSNATSAVDVLNDLLNYDKVESGQLSLELTEVKIWELIEQTFTEFQQQAKFNNIHYHLDFADLFQNADQEQQQHHNSATQLPQVVLNRKAVGDKIRISQVLRNLISNALKFSKDGGSLTVRPTWKPSKDAETKITLHSGEVNTYLCCGELQVEVADTGSGMTQEQLKRLFSEGVQFNVNELQAGQGSGLGLFIAKGIVEKHGGSLVATSEGIGKGTVFTMTLPLYMIPDPVQSDQNKEKLQTTPGAMSTGGVELLNVLVVDDTTMNRKLLARLLENKGHTCSQAEDGRVAVDMLKAEMSKGGHFDTILMDYEMPNMNGPEAAMECRRLGCDAFIVGVTGNLFAEDVATFKDCGANLVLPKPLDIQVLMDAFIEHGISSPSCRDRAHSD